METVSEESPKEGLENAQAESSNAEKPSTPQHAPPGAKPERKSKREERNKKDDKYVEQFIRAINAAPTLEEKMQIAIQKYSHIVDDNKKMQFYIKQSEKRHNLIVKEKEQLQLEFNKTILVKSKLENLCRELQKQNKAIKEESLHKIREEEERRKETQNKFQSTLSEITALLQQNNEKNAKLRDDNISMTEKFKSVVQQYQLREQQVEKMAKQMSLEQQLSDAKFQKAALEHQAEKERLLAEMEGIKVTAAQFRAKIVELQGTETGLRSQLSVYTDKYDEFQNALVKSNQVFGGFKEQMEKMSKKIKKLEKESLSWKQRWETSQTALLDMCGERQASEERAAAAARQLLHMQSLCRTLQAERTVLLNTLKENDIERPPLPAPTPAPAPPAPAPALNANNAKVDAMAANCAQLRQSLAHLQSQLNVLTTKQQTPTPEETSKPEKSKKSKSKKLKRLEVLKESESDSNAKESATENESANEEKLVKVNTIVGDVDTISEKVETTSSKVDAKSEKVDTTSSKVDAKSEKVDAIIAKVDTTSEKVDTTVAKANTSDKAGTANNPVDIIDDELDEVQTIEIAGEKVDDETLESLIQAINSANINLCDLEVVGDSKIEIDDVLNLDSLPKEEAVNPTITTSNVPEITDSNDKKDTPKIIELENGLEESSSVEKSNTGIPKEVKQVANSKTKVTISQAAQVNDASV